MCAQGGTTNRTISLKFELLNGDQIFVCGYKYKEAYKYAQFYIEFNVPKTVAKDSYVPSTSTKYVGSDAPILWTRRKHYGDDTECTILYNIPHGHHILTINTGDTYGRNGNGEGKLHGSALTHLVTF